MLSGVDLRGFKLPRVIKEAARVTICYQIELIAGVIPQSFFVDNNNCSRHLAKI